MSRAARLALQVGLSVGLIAAVLWQADLHEIGNALRDSSPAWFARGGRHQRRGDRRHGPALAPAAGRASGAGSPATGGSSRRYLIALLLGQILPTAVGGDAVRAIDLTRRTGEPAEAVSSVVVDRVVGLAALGALAAAGALAGGSGIGRGTAVALGLGVLAVTALAGVRRSSRSACSRCCAAARRSRRACASRARCARSTARCTPIARVRARSRGSSSSACSRRACAPSRSASWPTGMGLDISFATLLVLCPVLFLVTIVPVSLNGIGLREATFVVVLGSAGDVARGRLRARPGVFRGRSGHRRARRAGAPAPRDPARPRQDWRVPSSNVKSAMRRLVLAAATLCAVAGVALWSTAAAIPRAAAQLAHHRRRARPRRGREPRARAARRAGHGARRARCCRCATPRGSPQRLTAPVRRARRRPGRGAAARPGHLAGRRAHRRRRAAVARPDRRGHPHRRRRPRLRRQLAQPARQGAPAADADRRRSSRSTTPAASPRSRASRTPTSRPGHGANVAQVVWDIAPGARYTFVNYHTQLELSQAVDWLVNGPDGKPRVDIVVHSNSFLDGPFDGTGVAAQAVNRAHDAGIFWANSAGNYARRHWEGVVGDPDKDGWADIGPGGRGYLDVPADRQHRHGGDALLEQLQQERRGRRRPRARASSSTSPTPRRARPSSTRRAEGRLAAGRVGRATSRPRPGRTACASSSAPPASSATSRSSAAASSSATRPRPESSMPTPGDARGSFTVGARDWQGDAAADYSSQGPTEDGRLKPDVVAPASTAVWPGVAMVGTSASAPHAAGAAALLMQRDRAAGPAERSRHDRQGADRRARSTSRRPARTRSRARAASGSISIRRPGSRRRLPPASPSATRRASTSTSTMPARSRPPASRSTASSLAEVAGVLHRRLDTAGARAGPAHGASSGRATWPATAPSCRCRSSATARAPTLALSSSGNALEVTVADAESRTGSLRGADRRRDRRAARASARCR